MRNYGTDQPEPARDRVVIVIPVFNDWDSLGVLIRELDGVFRNQTIAVHLLIVDDGSTASPPDLGALLSATQLDATLLRLVRNMGHQRAIALGLSHAVIHLRPTSIVIMDGDGEDRPSDVPGLLRELAGHPDAIVVANRARRHEGLRFALFYHLYKRIFSLLTGTAISFGNFSAVRVATARRLVNMHELLLHVPATLIRSRCPIRRVDTDRGERYAGQSRMSLTSLVVHGLSSIAVFSEATFTRILIFCAGIFLLCGVAVTAAVLLKLLGMATPGWTTMVAGILMIVLVQNATIALGGLFIVLNNKRDFTLVPWRVAPDFIAEVSSLGPNPEKRSSGSEGRSGRVTLSMSATGARDTGSPAGLPPGTSKPRCSP